MTNLRAGIVGLGVMGRHHLRILSQLEGVDLVGVFDPALNTQNDVAGVAVMPSLEALLDCRLDYCVLAAPTASHLDLGLLLADRSIPTLIEKPIAANSSEARLLTEAFESRGLIAAVGHIERFNPAIQSMRQRIEDGLLGNVIQISTRRQGPFPARITDVGVTKDLATHDLDITMWVLNDDYLSIAGQTAHRSGRANEDMLVAIGRLTRGAITNHIVNWLSPFKERTTVVTGEMGALVADTLTSDLTHFENATHSTSWEGISTFRGVSEGNITRFALTKTEPLLAEHLAFREAVRTGRSTAIVTLRQGERVVQVADTLLQGVSNLAESDVEQFRYNR